MNTINTGAMTATREYEEAMAEASQQPAELEQRGQMVELERIKTGASHESHARKKRGGLFRSITQNSRVFSERRQGRYEPGSDDELDGPILSKAESWALMPEVKQRHQLGEKDGLVSRKLGVTWNNLTVKGVASGGVVQVCKAPSLIFEAIADWLTQENYFSQFNIPQQIKEGRNKAALTTILADNHGHVAPGEMLLVLGRPGSGCTTLLKMLANRRNGYAKVEGDVRWGTFDHKQAVQYCGQIVMNTEEELFFPTLTVGETIDFATRLKVPYHTPSQYANAEEYRKQNRDFLLRSMGIAHTEGTRVGSEYVRGVSGGERKRVSIIECLATRASVFCWDNSTRGLDASTALDYTKAIRALTDIFGLASIVTLYQAGNGIYELFDKVLVLDESQEIYYGPQAGARPFMESLGFYCDPAANVADFLTGVTVPTERQIVPGFEDRFPRTAEEIRKAYEQTDICRQMAAEYDFPTTAKASQFTEDFKAAVQHDKHPSELKRSQFTVSFVAQVEACIKRQYQIIWGDKATFIIKQGATLVQALIAGSMFYKAPDNSSGLFLKGGALFFLILYNALQAMSEIVVSFSGRAVLAKHRSFGIFHPAAFCIAQIVADIPVLLLQVTQFTIVIAFMVGLAKSAGQYFTLWVITLAVTFCMTSIFRAIAALSQTFHGAMKLAGTLLTIIIPLAGYQIPKVWMQPQVVWIFWINPLAYGFEALMGNEFHGKELPCVNNNLVPNGGEMYMDSRYQACAGVAGARPGSTVVNGDDYLASLSYYHKNVWRNFGIIWALWFLFVVLTIIGTSNWKEAGAAGQSNIQPREVIKKAKKAQSADKENQITEVAERTAKKAPNSSAGSESTAVNGDTEKQLIRNTSIFTWKDLTYVVKTPSGDRTLLDNVQGWVKPGMLGALMGASGAGKTTLLDVLAQRKTDGTIHGSIMVDGRPLNISFQRSAGYVEQLDVHEPLCTVRESLEFSALLRQSRDTPREEKLAYVDTIIDLLEMKDIENTLVGRVGAGLSVEQRKRLTIGVELVSKPSILIFLDEPTSGLDGQAAFSTVRFLRKLADVGQAVLVTIHQPSASLFAQFDTLLLLARGGKTVYFGDIGENSKQVKGYFGRNGADCPPNANPAEYIIEVCSGSLSKGRDWADIWLQSPEYQSITNELDRMIEDAAAKPAGYTEDGNEFAMPLWYQCKIVTRRSFRSVYRNTDYVNNKVVLHISCGLFNGWAFWKLGNTVAELQLTLFSVFNFIFVAPGVINQLQPLFIDRRDIFETRESKSRMYSWIAFVTGLILSEIPYLIFCGILYFACWYYAVGFPHDSNKAGAVLFICIIYEFVYTGIGQFVAAYAPNAMFAALVNPLIITTLVSFCGVLVPYDQIPVFWRYWMYYLNPFTYLMGGLLSFTLFDKEIVCSPQELAVFDTPNDVSCKEYLSEYMQGMGSRINLLNPDATSQCEVCQFRVGSDYLSTIHLGEYVYGWRDAAIVVLFAFSGYALVYALMKLRTKASKMAEN